MRSASTAIGLEAALPLLVVELPVPEGREDEWNTWYREVHMPDIVKNVAGVVRSRRYKVLSDGTDQEFRYIAIHEFATADQLSDYIFSAQVDGRWGDYAALWGAPPRFRRRGLVPIAEVLDSQEPAGSGQ